MTAALTASYERISYDRNSDEAGVERQYADNVKLADAKGRSIDRRYTDNDISALDEGKQRPGFEALVADVAAGHVGMIVVWAMDRLCVRVDDLTKLLKAGREHGVTIAAVHGIGIDMSDPTGVAVAHILTAVAEMERRHKGVRQRAANRQRAERGIVRWSHRPFGYDLDDAGRIVVVEEEARWLRYVAGRVFAGASLNRMCRVLNRAGCGDRDWQPTPLRELLLNPRHAGRAVLNGNDYGPGDWEPVFDPDTAERLTIKLRDPRRRTNTGNGHKHLLSGIARCGECDRKMYATPQPAGSDRLIYKCPKGHVARLLAPIDEYVLEVLVARLARPDAREMFVPRADEVDELAREANELRDRRDAIAAMLADGLFSPDAAREQAGRLTGRLDEIEREIEARQGVGPLAPFADVTDVEQARNVWDKLELKRRRAVVRRLMNVTVHRGSRGRFDRATVQIGWREVDGQT